METFEIPVTQQQLELLNAPAADIAALLALMFKPLSENYRQLTFELQREFRHGGSPEVTRLAFDRVLFDAASGKGRCRIVLDVSFTFGCEDTVTTKKDQTSEWTFAVDKASRTISFYSSPFAESRSTADEF